MNPCVSEWYVHVMYFVGVVIGWVVCEISHHLFSVEADRED